MTTFDDILVNDADAFFELGKEAGKYRKTPTGTERTIELLVDREAADMPAGGLVGKRNLIRVSVRNLVTTGILRTEIDEGQDEIKVARVKGGTIEWFHIAKVLNDDAGLIYLELR